MNDNTPKKKGLIVNVYRDGHRPTDCTMNGISKRYDRFVLVGAGIDEIFEASEDMPAIELVPAVQGGKRAHVKEQGDQRWLMFGGNFVYSSDSRFAALNNGNPIAVFDRYEP